MRMGFPGQALPIARNRVARRTRTASAERGRWVLLALTTLAIVPADDGGGNAWTSAVAIAVVALLLLIRRVLRRAAAKVEAALTDELDHR